MTHAIGQDAWRAICAANPGIPYDKETKVAETYDFSLALEYLKAGKRVARAGWNGKGMFVLLVPVGTVFNHLPHIDMFTAQGDVVPWLASQTDLLADDWMDA